MSKPEYFKKLKTSEVMATMNIAILVSLFPWYSHGIVEFQQFLSTFFKV